MKICQINCVYGRGSTGKIVKVIHNSLIKNGESSVVIYPIKSTENEPGVYTVSNRLLSKCSALYRRLTGRQFDGAHIQTSRIISILKAEKPDLVHIHCINGNNINIYRLMNYLSKNDIPTVITLHAEFQYTGGCGHAFDCERWKYGCGKCPNLKEATNSFLFDGTAHTWKAQSRCYSKFKRDKLTVVAVSPWLMSRAEQSPMLKPFAPTCVFNGVDTSVFYRRENTEELRKKHFGECNDKIVLHVSAHFDTRTYNAKGGRYIIDLANAMKDKPVKFVVTATRADFDELPDNVIFAGRTKGQDELAELYSIADLTVITSRRETFSMPVAESLCCGTKVTGFFAGGPESITTEENARFVEYGNTDALARVISEELEKEDNGAYERSLAAKEIYGEDTMYAGYLEIYKKMIIDR